MASWSISMRPSVRHAERGTTLVETMIASLVLIIGLVSTMSIFTLAVAQDSNQGDRATRATEYAQDKMEQLMALSFSDAATKTTVYPTQATGGTGLGGAMAGSATVGSVDPAGAVTGYVDYLDKTGSLVLTAANDSFIRQWSITTNAAANLKTITVYVRAATALRGQGAAPSATLISAKTN